MDVLPNLPGWFSEDIKISIRLRDQLKRENKIDQSKQQRNKVTHLVRKNKKQFYNMSIKENKSTKYLWKNINSLTKSQKPLTLPTRIQTNDHTYVEDSASILHALNSHFTNISNIIETTNYGASKFATLKSVLDNKLDTDYFDIDFIFTVEVRKIIDNLDGFKASGLDQIGPTVLK